MEYNCEECPFKEIEIIWCKRYGCKMKSLDAKNNFITELDNIKDNMIDERYHKTKAKSKIIGYLR